MIDIFEYIEESNNGALISRVESIMDEIFSKQFSSELSKILSEIKIRDVPRNDDVVATAVYSKEIKINPAEFDKLSKERQALFIIHELIHASYSKGNAKLRILSRQLWKLYNSNKLHGYDVSMCMVGKANVRKRWINKQETVNYLVTEDPNFEYMKPGTNLQMKAMMEKSKLFNMNSFFWKRKGIV